MWGLGKNKQTNKHNTQMIEQKTTWRHGDSRSPRQLSFQRATSPPDGQDDDDHHEGWEL